MLVYGDDNFFFLSESCIDKVNRNRTSNIHLKKNKLDIDENKMGILNKSNSEYIIKMYENGITTDKRAMFLSQLCSIIKLICEHSNVEFIKLCLPFYLLGHSKMQEEILLHKSVKLCRCQNKNDKSKLEQIEIIISKEKI